MAKRLLFLTAVVVSFGAFQYYDILGKTLLLPAATKTRRNAVTNMNVDTLGPDGLLAIPATTTRRNTATKININMPGPEDVLAIPATTTQRNTATGREHVVAIIPTCSRYNPVRDAIESVLAQTRPVLQVVVAIDSGEKCMKQMENIWGEKVLILKMKPCPSDLRGCVAGHASRARNHAIDNADPRATHFAFLDDDDIWLPNKTEIQLAAMRRDGVGIISSDALYPLPNAQRCKNEKYFPWNISKSSDFRAWNGGRWKNIMMQKFRGELPTHVTSKEFQIHNILVTSATVVTKEALGNGFDIRLKNGMEDQGLWRHILKSMPATFLWSPLAVYDSYHGKGCLSPAARQSSGSR